MQTKIDKCCIHGKTEFRYYEKKNKKGQWICLKCNSELAILKKQELKLKAVNYKGGKCEICGYNKNLSALEFHHLNPEQKDFTISKTRHAWKDVKKELDKCICVCANCHRELHNPQSTFENIQDLIKKHSDDLKFKTKDKYRYTLQELNDKRSEMNTWQEVADYYNVSLSTIKRHREELKQQKQT